MLNKTKEDLLERALQAMAHGNEQKANLFMFRAVLHIQHDEILAEYIKAVDAEDGLQIDMWYTALTVFYKMYPIMEPDTMKEIN